MPHRYHFLQADVFTDKPFGGNPLAVFTNARRVVIEQGIEMGRPSQIHVEVKTSGVSG